MMSADCFESVTRVTLFFCALLYTCTPVITVHWTGLLYFHGDDLHRKETRASGKITNDNRTNIESGQCTAFFLVVSFEATRRAAQKVTQIPFIVRGEEQGKSYLNLYIYSCMCVYLHVCYTFLKCLKKWSESLVAKIENENGLILRLHAKFDGAMKWHYSQNSYPPTPTHCFSWNYLRDDLQLITLWKYISQTEATRGLKYKWLQMEDDLK